MVDSYCDVRDFLLNVLLDDSILFSSQRKKNLDRILRVWPRSYAPFFVFLFVGFLHLI